MKLKDKRFLLEEEINKLQAEIYKLQKRCKHKNVNVIHTGSTGGYERDVFWKEFKCPDCGKSWTEDD